MKSFGMLKLIRDKKKADANVRQIGDGWKDDIYKQTAQAHTACTIWFRQAETGWLFCLKYNKLIDIFQGNFVTLRDSQSASDGT